MTKNKSLKFSVQNVKGISHIDIELNLSPGLYAITGKNGSGKSTLITALSCLFNFDSLKFFFHNALSDESKIQYEIENKKLLCTFKIKEKYNYLMEKTQTGYPPISLRGFHEGSIIHGNRFRDTNVKTILMSSGVPDNELEEAPEFVKDNMGEILQNDKKYYSNLYYLKKQSAVKYGFRTFQYFLKTSSGNKINQYSLSTGEALLISVLNSLHNLRIDKKKSDNYYVVLLDEIELALHPTALIRLVKFLKSMSIEKQIPIYFSTHSIELLREIQPDNIYFLIKHSNKKIEVINPCYPAYATRSVYTHDGYDMLILVEDELARRIVLKILDKYSFNKSRLIHVIPAGGWENVLTLHQEIRDQNILGVGKNSMTILDGDIIADFEIKKREKPEFKNIVVNFLPIKSAEKYLRNKLVGDNIDFRFLRDFGDAFFRKKPLEEILEEYNNFIKDKQAPDGNGKILFRMIKNGLLASKSDETIFIERLSNYLVEKEDMTEIVAFFEKNL